MSRAGCCCGGGTDPGECCTTPPYQEGGRRYRLTIGIGPWPGSGFNLQSNVGVAVCFTQNCNADPQCPNVQRVTRARETTTKVDLTWGGGNGTGTIIPITGALIPSNCDPCFPWYDDPGVVGYYTESYVPGGGVDGVLEWIQTTNPSDTTTVQMTWMSGTTDPVYGASVSGFMYRGQTTSGAGNVMRSCKDDAPCDKMYGALITAELPVLWSLPCDIFGTGNDGTRANVAETSAMYYGCPDQDNRYLGENRYATREFSINRVRAPYGQAAGYAWFDGVSGASGQDIQDILAYRIDTVAACGDPCKGNCVITGVQYIDCPGQTYTLTESENLPPLCPNAIPGGFWWQPDTAPHPFPAEVQIIRLPPNPPTITNSTPSSGPAAGGTVVTITGTNFIQVTDVKFGANRCASLLSNTSTSMTVAAPAGTAGTTVSIIVITDGGTATRTNAFTYT